VNRFIAKIASIALLQGLILLVSLPVLVAWGLPISLLGVIGNIIFLPVIIVFLLLSALLTLFLPIPFLAKFLGVLLDGVVAIWRLFGALCVSFGNLALPFYGYLPLAVFFCLILFLVHNRFLCRFLVRTTVIFSVIVLLILFSLFRCWGTNERLFSCGSERLHCTRGVAGVQVVDHGGRRQVKTLDTWVRYRLPQFLAQTFGVVSIAVYHVRHITPAVCETVRVLCEGHLIEAIEICETEKQDKCLLAQIHAYAEQAGTPIRC